MDRHQRKVLKICACLQLTLSYQFASEMIIICTHLQLLLAWNNLYETMSHMIESDLSGDQLRTKIGWVNSKNRIMYLQNEHLTWTKPCFLSGTLLVSNLTTWLHQYPYGRRDELSVFFKKKAEPLCITYSEQQQNHFRSKIWALIYTEKSQPQFWSDVYSHQWWICLPLRISFNQLQKQTYWGSII